MAKIGLEFAGFDEVLKKLTALNADIKPIANEALKQTHDIITERVKRATVSANFPAQGRYSGGQTAESIVDNLIINWSETVGSVEVGFDIKHGGLPSIFLMYGTPKMPKVQQMYDAFFSEQAKAEVLNAQKTVFYDALERLQ